MKPCITCHNKPMKNGIFKAELQHFADKNLPKDNKCYHDKSGNKIHITGLKPNKTIFYFATNQHDFTKSIKPRVKAYDKLQNSGVLRINKDGEADAYLHCPQLYINHDGKVYSRHFHFLYWNDDKKEWDKNLFTQQILCDVDNDFVGKHIKKSILIDARPEEYYTKEHVKGAISMPYNKKWTEEMVFEKIKTENKLVPIILYCAKGCNAAYKLYEKLNKLEFYNTMHANDL